MRFLLFFSKGDKKDGEKEREREKGTSEDEEEKLKIIIKKKKKKKKKYRCFNGAPNTSFLSSSSPAVLDAAGFIKVDEHLRVLGKEAEGWFALGDASAAPGVKLGYLARAQAATVAANIRAAIKAAKEKEAGNKPSSALPPSKWTPNNGFEMMLVTLGKGSGTGHLGRWVRFPGLAVAAIKGRDLFVGKTRAGLGVA